MANNKGMFEAPERWEGIVNPQYGTLVKIPPQLDLWRQFDIKPKPDYGLIRIPYFVALGQGYPEPIPCAGFVNGFRPPNKP
jgi:hypothetical protein